MSVGAWRRGLLWVGPARPCRGWGSERLGRGGRWIRRCSTMRAPPKDTITQRSQCDCFGEQTATGEVPPNRGGMHYEE